MYLSMFLHNTVLVFQFSKYVFFKDTLLSSVQRAAGRMLFAGRAGFFIFHDEKQQQRQHIFCVKFRLGCSAHAMGYINACFEKDLPDPAMVSRDVCDSPTHLSAVQWDEIRISVARSTLY